MKIPKFTETLILTLYAAFSVFLFFDSSRAGEKAHQLNFDFSFAEEAIQYLETGNEKILHTMAHGPAAAHLWRHARDMNPDLHYDSPCSMIKSMMTSRQEQADCIPLVQRNLSYAREFVRDDRDFVQAALCLLPPDFEFDGSLFFTFGYDIGVAHGKNASLNLAHPRFLENPEEMIFYAAHELHHIGFMQYHPFPVLGGMRTAEDLVYLIEYCTQMEGMAVYAAYELRENKGALKNDKDYVALQDEEWMRKNEEVYFSLYNQLKIRRAKEIRKEDWDIIHIFSDKKRLWYRIGCHMAMIIEEEMGRDYLINLIQKGPRIFIQKYSEIKTKRQNRRSFIHEVHDLIDLGDFALFQSF